MKRANSQTVKTTEQSSPSAQSVWQREIKQILEQTWAAPPTRSESLAQEERQAHSRAGNDDIGQNMRALDAAMGDVLAAVADRVRAGLIDYVRQEVPRVLQDALGTEKEFAHEAQQAVDGETAVQSEQQRHETLEDRSPDIPRWLVGGSRWVGAPPPARVSVQADDANVSPNPPKDVLGDSP